MSEHARVAVIGGGIMGCGLLYQLARMGWTDTVLLEKNDLTAGTTWHSAGNIPHFNTSALLTRLHAETPRAYRELEADTGQSVGWHETGGLRLGGTELQMQENRRHAAKARVLGMTMDMVGVEEIAKLHPLISTHELIGAAYTPEEGYVDPSSVTQAYAAGARSRGATIKRDARVRSIARTRTGEWEIATDAGTWTAEIVVNCAGFWAPEIGRMVGARMPIVPMERQYIVTDTVPELAEIGRELPTLQSLVGPFYVRQERDGFLFGVYEKETPFWSLEGIPEDFGQELLPADLDRASDCIQAVIDRVPAIGEVGVKQVICGPTSRTVDHNGLMGPVPGLTNFYVYAGFSGGIVQAGSTSPLMAEWIVEGQPSIDLWELDIRRFGEYANTRYTCARVSEHHAYGAHVQLPGAQARKGRPIKTSPLHDRLIARGARMSESHGWEIPEWFAREDGAEMEPSGFGRAAWFDTVGEECRAVHDRAGLFDCSSIAKYAVSGPGAVRFLDTVCANALPEPGGVAASLMLTEQGGIAGRLVVARLGTDGFYLTAPRDVEIHHLDLLFRRLPEDGSVHLANVTGQYGALLLAGPESRAALADLTSSDLESGAFPVGTVQALDLGYAPARVLRHGEVGELAWEIHVPAQYLRALYDLLAEGHTGRLTDFGWRAYESLRLEAGARAWPVDMDSTDGPKEAGLENEIDMEKPGFVGRDAARRRAEQGAGRLLACLVLSGDGPDAWGDEPVFRDGEPVSIVRSAAFGHRIGKSLALACLPAELATPGTELAVEIMGERRPATVAAGALYDQDNARAAA